jgi:hypothetical protein
MHSNEAALMPSPTEADISGMLPCAPADPLLAKQKEFTDRVSTLKHSVDLAAFIEDIDIWMAVPACVAVFHPKNSMGHRG